MPSNPNSAHLLSRARTVTPGGVNSPVRAFGAVGGNPRVMRSAHGAYLVDVDNHRYVDLIGSWGPMILGHTHPEVLATITETAARGFSFGTPSENETALAENIVQRFPPIEQVRLVNSGTEATMSALRLARGITGRDAVIKFAGCYHGHVDSFLAAAGSGLATFALPDSAGVPAATTKDTIVVPYNDPAALTAAFAAHGPRIAAIITEACPGNMGIVPPQPGFSTLIRRLATENGALVISDEVMTGFRASPTGYYGIDTELQADLYTFGKVMGGGFPTAAFAGSSTHMEHLAPTGGVYQAGTLSGNPVATAAGLATLERCTPAVYDKLTHAATSIADAVTQALTAASVPHRIQWAGTMFSVFFTAEPVHNYEQANAQNLPAFAAFFHSMLQNGVHLPPSAFETWFVSAAHDDEVIDRVITALPAAAAVAAATGA